MVTEASPSGFRSRVPAKITSSIRAPRSDLADCSPSTQLIASLRLDLPQPFGPTIAVIPEPWNRISVRSQKDLKPWISTRFSLSKPAPPIPQDVLSGVLLHPKSNRSKSKDMGHAILGFISESYKI